MTEGDIAAIMIIAAYILGVGSGYLWAVRTKDDNLPNKGIQKPQD